MRLSKCIKNNHLASTGYLSLDTMGKFERVGERVEWWESLQKKAWLSNPWGKVLNQV